MNRGCSHAGAHILDERERKLHLLLHLLIHRLLIGFLKSQFKVFLLRHEPCIHRREGIVIDDTFKPLVLQFLHLGIHRRKVRFHLRSLLYGHLLLLTGQIDEDGFIQCHYCLARLQ